MKKSGIVILLIISSLGLYSQTKTSLVKGFAYERESTPGIIPKTIGEDGKETTREIPRIKSYQLFLEYKKGTTIKPSRIWINGIAYKAKTENIKSTPVLFKTSTGSDNYETDTLVKKTKNSVMQLWIDGEIKPPPKVKLENGKDKISVEYYYKGKSYLYTFKEIKKIAPQILQ